jgi:hypothetical protein
MIDSYDFENIFVTGLELVAFPCCQEWVKNTYRVYFDLNHHVEMNSLTVTVIFNRNCNKRNNKKELLFHNTPNLLASVTIIINIDNVW